MKFRRSSIVFVCTLLAMSVTAAMPAHAQTAALVKVSHADTLKAYRVDAARHIYATYPDKVYKGKLPPLMHAIVVTEVSLDESGHVRDINMIRTPSHAPDVTAAVRNMIQHASPMPAPQRLGGAKFTEIWLVDKSGRFQLDALTEGQR